ncbi:MAG: VCBS repeat-containing protein [Algibacter sp.]
MMKYKILFFYTLLLVVVACDKKKEDNNLSLLEFLQVEETGINFSNDIKEGLGQNDNILTYTNFYNGGGVAVGDINNDGLVDLYLSANQKTGKLFLNKGGFKFKDITPKSGLDTISGWKTGVTMVDINQDNLLDIYVCRSGRVHPQNKTNLLFINNGDLTFTESAKEYGLDDSSNSIQATFFDYDIDGDLDMFLLNHAIDPIKKLTRHLDDYEDDTNIGDKLYKNTDGHFTEVGKSTGIQQSPLGDGLGVAVGDLYNDGQPSIYVCNDFLGRDYLYSYTGKETFKENALQAMNHISYSSMGVDMADINNDGWQDIFVVDMKSSTNYGRKTNMASMDPKAFDILVKVGGHYQYMRNTLQMNNGNHTFSDIAPMAGLASSDWSWAPLFVDLDNDGFKDLFITNGIRKNTNNKDYDTYRKERFEIERKKVRPDVKSLVKEILNKVPTEEAVNLVYKNIDGLSFEKKNKNWGVNIPSFSNGAAYADFDNDGDMDLVINNVDQPAHVYRNNSTEISNNHYIKVKLNGNPLNVNGIGAKVMVQTNGGKQFIEQHVSRGYQSSVDFKLHFGLGNNEIIDTLRVTWPDGKVNEMTKVVANQLVSINYNKATEPSQVKEKEDTLLFSDITKAYGLSHEHMENGYNDFKREVLLPHKMSTFGPALAVGDINQDGLDDFFIGGSKNYEGAIYLQNANKTFTKTNQKQIITDRIHEDLDALFFDADNDGDLDLYVVSGGNEMPIGHPYYQDRLYINNGQGIFTKSTISIPKMHASGGVVKANDFDADGDLDLFIGGRLLPGKYPKTSRSYLLENINGQFTDVTSKHTSDLEFPGMVTDAIWSDYNSDGIKDLILVGEWMPITIFENNSGTLSKLKQNSGLDKSHGWWFSITEADVNNDGSMDYLLGNLGENYKYTTTPEAPFNLYSNDFDNNGSLDIVLSFYENDTLYPLRGKECSTQQIPALKNKFKNYNAFGLATLEDVYDTKSLENATHLKAHTFSNSILINNKERFNLVKLPKEAQASSVFGILYNDFDSDGLNDLVIAGNLFNSETETPRNDAGQGLFLKGNGTENFTPVSNYISGLNIPGDVKKVKPIRLGKADDAKNGFIVAVNNDFLKLIEIN